MFSFSKIVTFATLAFGAVVSVSAMPQPGAVTEVKRQSTSLTSILADLNTGLQPLSEQLTRGASGATTAKMNPIITQMTSKVQDAMTEIKALPPQDITSSDATSALSSVFKTALSPAQTLMNTPGVSALALTSAISPLGDLSPLSRHSSVLSGLLLVVAEVVLVVGATLNTLLGGLSGVILSLALNPLILVLGL
ncbi:hypothetical protein EW146_g2784 [Bondarzewia mesenterica]|uniref:Uncharacterized protein n=1 Tax=Bondarzewia mesenterica TaxID=1095465 RepID=A0A4S4M5T2_9AGAM|nr:hypothetical protein EW146_g2784 [Bondarzewia mesenterica]